MYTQNVISEKFNEVLKGYDLSPEQFNVLRILKGQHGNPTNMCVIQERMIADMKQIITSQKQIINENNLDSGNGLE